MISKTVNALARGLVAAALVVTLPIATAQAGELFSRNTPSQQGRDKGQYIPTIAVTPDGCEAWVMDDGAEGYAVEHVNRQGIPVCRDINVCGVMYSDQYFPTDSYRITSAGKAKLAEFFRGSNSFGYIIAGHTDSRASDEYNMRLSLNRANAVARVAQSTGARIIDVRGYGERMPVAANNSAAGMAKNRRVEILCVQ